MYQAVPNFNYLTSVPQCTKYSSLYQTLSKFTNLYNLYQPVPNLTVPALIFVSRCGNTVWWVGPHSNK